MISYDTKSKENNIFGWTPGHCDLGCCAISLLRTMATDCPVWRPICLNSDFSIWLARRVAFFYEIRLCNYYDIGENHEFFLNSVSSLAEIIPGNVDNLNIGLFYSRIDLP